MDGSMGDSLTKCDLEPWSPGAREPWMSLIPSDPTQRDHLENDLGNYPQFI